MSRTHESTLQTKNHPGIVFIRRAKNELLRDEPTVGSRRNRSLGCGSHRGKPGFGHDGPLERDRVARIIGQHTKANKRLKAQCKARNNVTHHTTLP